MFEDIETAGEDTPYYTNSCHMPVGFTDDIFEALEVQEVLQTKFTGGTVLHTFLGEKISDWETTKNLVKKIAENFRVPYYTISPTYSVCKTHGYITGEVHKCPQCGVETEVYSRITGYYRPIKHWNDGKREEFNQRKEYLVGKYEIKKSCDTEKNTDEKVILFTTKICPNCPRAKDRVS